MRIFLVCLILFSAGSIKSLGNNQYWGFFAHKEINRLAVFSLPNPLFKFYKHHIDYIAEHAIDPDKRRYAVVGEAECHYIDVDYYGRNIDAIKSTLPVFWDSAVTKFSEDTLRKHGILPWNLNLMLVKLTKAFEEKNTNKILKLSADLGHYLADAHVPLHTTTNYNGQLTNQIGIHALWETRVPELLWNSFNTIVDKAIYIDSPTKFIWSTVFKSHQQVDSVLSLENELNIMISENKFTYTERGNSFGKNYSEAYTNGYNEALNKMAERNLREATHSIASFWYTAWVNAGQPNLSETNFSNEPSEVDTVKKVIQPEIIRPHD